MNGRVEGYKDGLAHRYARRSLEVIDSMITVQ